jgi:hypothetical protein
MPSVRITTDVFVIGQSLTDTVNRSSLNLQGMGTSAIISCLFKAGLIVCYSRLKPRHLAMRYGDV